jgi:hypothetical protein
MTTQQSKHTKAAKGPCKKLAAGAGVEPLQLLLMLQP